MKSRITIQVDFVNGNLPVIQILQYPDSEDVRDKLVKQFTQLTGGGSWCRLLWTIGGIYHNKLYIEPIQPHQLKDEAAKMIEEADRHEKWLKEHDPVAKS